MSEASEENHGAVEGDATGPALEELPLAWVEADPSWNCRAPYVEAEVQGAVERYRHEPMLHPPSVVRLGERRFQLVTGFLRFEVSPPATKRTTSTDITGLHETTGGTVDGSRRAPRSRDGREGAARHERRVRAGSRRFGSWKSAVVSWVAPGLAVEDEDVAELGDALGDHLSVQRVGEDLRPLLEGSVGGDGC